MVLLSQSHLMWNLVILFKLHKFHLVCCGPSRNHLNRGAIYLKTCMQQKLQFHYFHQVHCAQSAWPCWFKVCSIRLHHVNQFMRCSNLPFISAVQQWHPLNCTISFKRCRAGSHFCCTLSTVSVDLVHTYVCESVAQPMTQHTCASADTTPHTCVCCACTSVGVFTLQKPITPAVQDLCTRYTLVGQTITPAQRLHLGIHFECCAVPAAQKSSCTISEPLWTCSQWCRWIQLTFSSTSWWTAAALP